MGALAIAVLLVAYALSGSVRQLVLDLAEWFRGAGAVGMAAYVLLYTASALVVLPASGFTLLAGFAYGLGPGFALVLPAATVAAGVNFWFARLLGRERVERVLSPTSPWRAVLTAAAKQGFRWVLLLRLSPVVPFSVLNYLMGASRVTFRSFIVASTLGKAPSAFAYVYLGSAAQQLTASDDPQNAGTRGLFWLGLVCTCLVAFQISRVMRRHTRELLAVPPSDN